MDTRTQGYSFKQIFGLASEFRQELILANILAILAALSSAPLPLLIPLLIDQVLLEEPARLIAAIDYFLPDHLQTALMYIGVVLAVTILLRLIAWVLTVWQIWIFSRISKQIIFRIRSHLLSHLSRIAISEYEDKGGGTISSYLVTDLETLDQFFSLTISRFLVAVLMLVSVTVVLIFLHWQLAVFLLLLNPFVIYITVKLGRQMKELKRKENKAMEVFQQAVVDMLSAIRQIRVSSRDGHYIGKLIHNARDIRNKSTAFAWRNEMGNRFSFLFFVISFDVFRAVGMAMVLFSDLSIGVMIAIFGYLWFMLAPLQEILDMQYSWFSAKAALERINKILKMNQEPSYIAHANPFTGRSTVSIAAQDLCLKYGDMDALKHIDLQIQAGEKVAIVGTTGSGKTSFVQTLMGLYQPDQGEVLYEGVSIKDIGFTNVRENVGCVLQNPILLNDTIRANVTMGQEMPDEEIWKALEVAQIASFVRSKPEQMETIVGLQGVRLSGGQQQRFAIARMFLNNPKVVILDEATSALDSQTEQALHRTLFEALADKTMLIVAHRLSAVLHADHIYVLENGTITEQGAHDELVQIGKVYQQLFAAQL